MRTFIAQSNVNLHASMQQCGTDYAASQGDFGLWRSPWGISPCSCNRSTWTCDSKAQVHIDLWRWISLRTKVWIWCTPPVTITILSLSWQNVQNDSNPSTKSHKICSAIWHLGPNGLKWIRGWDVLCDYGLVCSELVSTSAPLLPLRKFAWSCGEAPLQGKDLGYENHE